MKTISRSCTLLGIALRSTFGLALMSALLWGSSALAGTLLVDDDKAECPDAGFKKIQRAVDAAAPGDIIEVCHGTYDEQVEIAKPVSLVGVRRDGKNAAVVKPSNIAVNADFLGTPTAAIILVHDTSDVTIRNITVDGINNGLVCDATFPTMDGIFYRNASGEIQFVVIKNMLSPQACAFADGLDVLSTDGGVWQLTVRDSSIHDYDTGGILSIGTGLHVSAIRNMISGRGVTDQGQAGIQFADGATGLIEQNIVTNTVTAGCPECDFVSSSIGVFSAEDARIVRNTVGNSNFGMFVGGSAGFDSRRASVLENRVFAADVFDGMVVIGDDNVVKDNSITNSDFLALFAQGANNTIQDNTINEAALGLLVSTGNNILHNRLFNTALTRRMFVPGAAATSSQDSLRPAVIAPSIVKKSHR